MLHAHTCAKLGYGTDRAELVQLVLSQHVPLCPCCEGHAKSKRAERVRVASAARWGAHPHCHHGSCVVCLSARPLSMELSWPRPCLTRLLARRTPSVDEERLHGDMCFHCIAPVLLSTRSRESHMSTAERHSACLKSAACVLRCVEVYCGWIPSTVRAFRSRSCTQSDGAGGCANPSVLLLTRKLRAQPTRRGGGRQRTVRVHARSATTGLQQAL